MKKENNINSSTVKMLIGVFLALAAPLFYAQGSYAKTPYTLQEAIDTALKNNPDIAAYEKGVYAEDYGVSIAKAERIPSLSLDSGVTRSRYPQPITPITGLPRNGVGFPEFDNTVYDFGVILTVPVYRGGRIEKGVYIAELKKAIAEDRLRSGRQELIYNVTSVFYKISQLEKLLTASEAAVKDLEDHKKDAELLFRAGSVPRVEIIKTEVELTHARQNEAILRNNLVSSYELLKGLMGMESDKEISITAEEAAESRRKGIKESIRDALSRRPDYKAAVKERKVSEEEVSYAEGKRLPQVNINGEYGDRSGNDLSFKENWFLGVRLSMPIFDGGIISSEVSRAKARAGMAKDMERAFRERIVREVKDAYLNIENARERSMTAQAAIEAARENLRIERLKYEAGEGTSTEVIDADTALLRAEADLYQALYDRSIAEASLRKAIGKEFAAK